MSSRTSGNIRKQTSSESQQNSGSSDEKIDLSFSAELQGTVEGIRRSFSDLFFVLDQNLSCEARQWKLMEEDFFEVRNLVSDKLLRHLDSSRMVPVET